MHTETKVKKSNPLLIYLQESFQELKKVSWPTRNQAMRLTVLVLSFVFVMSIIVGLMDLVFSFGKQKLIELAPPSSAQPTVDLGGEQPINTSAIKITPTAIGADGKELPAGAVTAVPQ
jgi:preprotein translocase subunit SecE